MDIEELRKKGPYDVCPRQLGNAIRFFRKYVEGMTQKELAGRLSVSANYICQIETGRRSVSLKQLNAIAVILKTPVWIFFLYAFNNAKKTKAI